jgi:hypothetical protein
LARDAVHRLILKDSQAEVETTLRELQWRLDTLDLQVQRLSIAADQVAAPSVARYRNGKM